MLNNNVNSQQLKQLQAQFQALTPEQQEQLRQQVAMQASTNPELLKENFNESGNFNVLHVLYNTPVNG